MSALNAMRLPGTLQGSISFAANLQAWLSPTRKYVACRVGWLKDEEGCSVQLKKGAKGHCGNFIIDKPVSFISAKRQALLIMSAARINKVSGIPCYDKSCVKIIFLGKHVFFPWTG